MSAGLWPQQKGYPRAGMDMSYCRLLCALQVKCVFVQRLGWASSHMISVDKLRVPLSAFPFYKISQIGVATDRKPRNIISEY